MDRSKRLLLKVLPLAAIAGVATKVMGHEGMVHELKPGKKYVFVIPNASNEEAAAMSKLLREQRGIDAIVIRGTEDVSIYELDA